MSKIIFLLSVILFSQTSKADALLEGEFRSIAKKLVMEMQCDLDIYGQETIEEFKKSIDETLITSSEKLILDGIEKDAINHTLVKPYKIEVNQKRWNEYNNSSYFKERLVLHEFLFTLRKDDSTYFYSHIYYNNILFNRIGRSGPCVPMPY